jgi:hypothetical protein
MSSEICFYRPLGNKLTISFYSIPALMALEPVLERILGPNNLSYEITLTHISLIVKKNVQSVRKFQTFKASIKLTNFFENY